MSCPVYDDESTVMHVEKAEVRRLRAIEEAARALVPLLPREEHHPPPYASPVSYGGAADPHVLPLADELRAALTGSKKS